MSDVPPDPTFADLLRMHRHGAGLSQAALAQRAELNPRSIKYLESGVRQPYPDTIHRLAMALGLSEAQRQQLVSATQPGSARRRPAPPPAAAEPRGPVGPSLDLPAALTSFIGRSDDLAALQALLAGARLVTLIGPGGIGKTRLALEAAADRVDAHPDGVWLVELAGVVDPASVTTVVAGILERRQQAVPPLVAPDGVERRQHDERPTLAWLTDALRFRSVLLVLDNCEHLVDACAALAEQLLRACPTVQILATSREALGAPGEHVFRVRPLHVSAGEPHLPELQQQPAIQLFVERAAAASGFSLTAHNAGAVAEICRRLDGLPLAIELAAGRTSLLTAEEIAARLDDRFRLLTSGVRTAPARHQTLRAVMAWSYDLAGEPQRRLFERLAVFAGGWTIEAGEAIAGDGSWIIGVDGDEPASPSPNTQHLTPNTLETLGQLVAQSLVTTEQEGGETRYRLLETLRELAAERLAERGETDGAARRHAVYFTELAEASEWGVHGLEQARWVRRLIREHDNLEAALRWSIGRGETELALRLVGALSRYWQTRPHRLNSWRWCDRVLALDASGVRPEPRAKVLIGATARALLGQDLDDARRYCQAGLALYAQGGDSFDHGRAMLFGGFVASAEGDLERAHVQMQGSLAMFRRLGHRWGEGLALGNLGVLAADGGDLAAAEQHLAASVAAFRNAGDAFELAVGLAKLGDISLRQGWLERARGYYEESLEQYRIAGTAHGDPIVLYNQACLLRQQHRLDRAAVLFQQALALHRERGDAAGIANCLLGLADLALTARQTTLAARLLGAADRLPRRILRGWIWPDEHGAFDAVMATARQTLGEIAFGIAFAEGQALTPEQAVAEASSLGEAAGAPTRLRPRRQMA